MNIDKFLLIIITCFFAVFLRIFISNNFVVSIIGSFIYGFIVDRKISNFKKEIILISFCACFTSYSGFIYSLHQIIIDGNYIKLVLYLNFVIIINLFIMYLGVLISRKII